MHISCTGAADLYVEKWRSQGSYFWDWEWRIVTPGMKCRGEVLPRLMMIEC